MDREDKAVQEGSKDELLVRDNHSMEDLLSREDFGESASTSGKARSASRNLKSKKPLTTKTPLLDNMQQIGSTSVAPLVISASAEHSPRPPKFVKPPSTKKQVPQSSSNRMPNLPFYVNGYTLSAEDVMNGPESSSSDEGNVTNSSARRGRSSVESKYRQRPDIKIDIDNASLHEAMTIDKRLRASRSVKKKVPANMSQIDASSDALLPKTASESSIYRNLERSHSAHSLIPDEGNGTFGGDIYDVYVPTTKASAGTGINYVELENYLRSIPYVAQGGPSSAIIDTKSSPQNEFSMSPSFIMNLSQNKKYTVYTSELGVCQTERLDRVGNGGLSSAIQKGMFWIDILAPTEYDMRVLSKTFQMHPLTVEDILTDETREKAEIFERYLFVCLRSFDSDVHSETFLDPYFIYILIFPEGVISIHHRPIPHVRNVVKRVHQAKEYFGISSDWIMYAILDDVVDSFMPHIGIMEMEVDSIDDLVLVLSDADQSDMLRRIGVARKRVTQLLRLLKTKLDIVRTFTKRCPARLKTHTLLYLRDIQDHVIGMVQDLDHFGETLNRSHGNYLAQISIDLTQASNRMNRVMKNLTAGASIVLPLSMIAGIWGMNVPVPGQHGIVSGDLGAFWVIIVSMAAIAAVMMYFGRKNQWF